jgi:hypothetical protein
MRVDLEVEKSFGTDGVSSVTWPEVIVVRRLAMQGNRPIAAAVPLSVRSVRHDTSR